MRRVVARWAAGLLGALAAAGLAQAHKPHFPEGVFTAKTIAIVNDTRTPQVEKGADDALASWGQFKVVEDPQLADVVLRFEKSRQHEGRNTETPGEDGKNASYGYSMSFSSRIEMKAFFKDADTPFYSTTTEDGKAKAGTSCINAFHTAFRDARQAGQPQP